MESSSDREKKSSGQPRYESPHGALLWTDAYEPQIRENNGKGWSRSASNDDYQSILAEFFQNTISPNIKLTGVYEKYLDPASYDFVGSRGETHAGADFTIGGNPQVRATTSGQVIEVGDNETYGKFVKIRDIGNDVHIYGHLKDVRVTKGQTVEGGAILGTIGHTGADTTILVDNEKPLVQSGDRLHYEIRDEDNVAYNPFTFFSYKQGGGRNGMVTLSGEDAMYHAAAEVFQKAAEYSSEPGVLKHNITSSKNVTFDGGFVIDDIPSHCTGMMGAVVKRMGYYTYPGSGYTNTNQGEGYMGGDVADKWGVGTGTAKIYNKDGSLSQDWETGSGSSTYGDITFNSTGNAHAHMPVFADTNGRVLGFNGGADDSFRNSLKLADYILRNGAPPTDVTYHETGERDRNGHMASDQIGAIANPMQYYVRYVGPPVTFYSDYYDSTDYFDENEIDTIEDQAAQDAAESYIESQDTSSGAPSKWKYTGDVTGTVYNKAGEKLCRFCLYDPEASYQNCKYYYDKWIKDDVVYFYSGYLPIKDSGNKKLQTVFVSQFEETAGKAAKTWFKENGIADPFKPSEVVYKPSDSENFETILTNLGIEKTHYYGNGVDKKLYLGWKDPLRFVNDFGTSREGFNNMISTYRDKYEYSDVAKINEPEPTENNYRYGNDPLWSLYVDAPRSERDKIESKINANKWAYAKNISKDAAKALKYNYSQKKNLGLTKEYLAKEKGFDIDLDDRWKKHTSEMTPNYQYGLVSKDKYKKVDPYGSGDASTIIPDIQPITSDTLLDSIVSQDQSPVIVNQYSTQSTDDHVLNSILTNTYNVRSEKIESTLEEMLQLMKEKNQRKRNQSSLLSTPSQPQSTSDSDFSNDIPSAIQRIAIG